MISIVISSQFLLVFLEPMKNVNFWICHQLWPSENWSIHPLCLSAKLLSVYWFSLRPICRYSSKHIFRVYVLYWYLLLSKYNRKTHMNCFYRWLRTRIIFCQLKAKVHMTIGGSREYLHEFYSLCKNILINLESCFLTCLDKD